MTHEAVLKASSGFGRDLLALLKDRSFECQGQKQKHYIFIRVESDRFYSMLVVSLRDSSLRVVAQDFRSFLTHQSIFDKKKMFTIKPQVSESGKNWQRLNISEIMFVYLFIS